MRSSNLGRHLPRRNIASIEPAKPGFSVAKATPLADGTFQLNGLAAGRYVFCLQSLPPGWLDPCHRAGPPVTVTLAAGQKLTGVSLKIKKGSILQIRVNDASNKLATNAPGSDVFVGVMSPHHLFYPVAITSTDAGGRNHQMTVPFDVPLKLTVASKQLQISDEKGAVLDAKGMTTAFQHSSAAGTPKGLTFNVIGTVPAPVKP